jgi:hypothetical protein
LFIGDLQEMLVKANLWIGQSADSGSNNDLPPETGKAVAEASRALDRTLKDGPLDFALSMRGPDRNNQFSVIGALSLHDTTALEKALRRVAKSVPEREVALIKLDAFKVQGASVHEIAVDKWLPPDARKVFGKNAVYLNLSPDAVFVTFGPRAREIITEALTGKLGPKPAPLAEAEISPKRILALYKTLGAAPEAIQFIDKLTAADRSTVMAIKLKGGDDLVLRVALGLPALWILAPKPRRGGALLPKEEGKYKE